MPNKGKADGKTGILFIYAHSRYWEFGGLLDKTPKQMLGQIIEVDVLPKETGQKLLRLRYRVTEVRQHIASWADISDVPKGRVVLQTSETDRHWKVRRYNSLHPADARSNAADLRIVCSGSAQQY
jgi:hypothetical protein